MKTIITSLLLLFCFNVSAQWKPSVSGDYPNYNGSIPFKDIPQSEINLGLHKFGEQHRTGNHLIIAGLVATTLGGLLMNPIKDSYPAGVFFMAVGGGLTTAGFIVNIDSFRHIK
jgi:hypothetical protein